MGLCGGVYYTRKPCAAAGWQGETVGCDWCVVRWGPAKRGEPCTKVHGFLNMLMAVGAGAAPRLCPPVATAL